MENMKQTSRFLSWLNEDSQEILTRSLLLLIGSFVILFFFVNILKNSDNITNSISIAPAKMVDYTPNITDTTKNIPLWPIQKMPASTADNSSVNINRISTLTSQTLILSNQDSLKKIFKHYNLSTNDLNQINNLPFAFLIMHQLAPHKKLVLSWNPQHQIQNLKYEINSSESLMLERTGSTFEEKILQNKSIKTLKSYSGTIQKNFKTTLATDNLPNSAITQLNAIFQNQLDLNTLNHGAHFHLIYEQTLAHSKNWHIDHLIAAEISQHGKIYGAVIDPENTSSFKYYKPNGQSLAKSFLRAPVHYDHISSPFDPHRYHPILHIYRPHYGVDFAAPYGTPVYTTSDGTVSFAGYEDGFGNVVKIRHDSTYSMLYAHLSRFYRKLHVGEHLKEGDVLGYAGSTGLATGSHVHYELHIHDVPVNPVTAKLPGSETVPFEHAAIFRGFAHRVLSLD